MIGPGSIVTAGGQALLVLSMEGGRAVVAPVFPLAKRRLAGDVALGPGQGMARSSQAQVVAAPPAGAAEIGRIDDALLAEYVKRAGLKRFRQMALQ